MFVIHCNYVIDIKYPMNATDESQRKLGLELGLGGYTFVLCKEAFVCFVHCTGRMTAVGFLFGPVSHVWYGYLDRWMPLANISTVLKKVLVDQAVAGPVFLAYFFAGKN